MGSARVCVGDLNAEKGDRLQQEFPASIKFIKCDTSDWDDQVQLFKTAATFSSDNRVSYVVANAGIIARDEIFSYEAEPKKPNLKVLDVNINGTAYTAKLAMHYFVKQNGTTPSQDQHDTCLVFIGSGAAFLDCLRGPTYEASKWAMRGLMHALRRTTHYYGSRVNMICPWYVKTGILDQEMWDTVEAAGVQLAKLEDAGECLLRIFSDTSINGHSLFVSARKWAPRGYIDLDLEDYSSSLMQEIQADQMVHEPASVGLFGPNAN